jgi:hypothetical protein
MGEQVLPIYIRCVVVTLRWHAAAILAFFLANLLLYRTGVAKYNRDDLTTFEVLHYTVVTYFTVGYGDVYPTSVPAQVLSWLNMATFFILTASACDLKGVE